MAAAELLFNTSADVRSSPSWSNILANHNAAADEDQTTLLTGVKIKHSISYRTLTKEAELQTQVRV